MTSVLLVGATVPSPLALKPALAAFSEAGATVDVALSREAWKNLKDQRYARARMIAPRRGVEGRRPRRFAPRWFLVIAKNGFVRYGLRRLDLPARTWAAARWDPAFMRYALEADIIVALDRYAIYTAWKVAKKNRDVTAVYGLDAALRVVKPT